MPDRFTVLISDFLDETSAEAAVLDNVADLVLANATDESQLSPFLPKAHAIITYHDLSLLGEPSFARAKQCRRRESRATSLTAELVSVCIPMTAWRTAGST